MPAPETIMHQHPPDTCAFLLFAMAHEGHTGNEDRAGATPEPTDPALLDFLSPSFDPALALSTPGLQPPDPDALPLDNVSRCRAILPPEVPESLANMTMKKASEESKLKAQQLKERAARMTQRVQDSCQMSLERVHSCVRAGPLSALGQWLKEGCRVRVVTRHARGIRGTASGLLVAYDRYMNVVLRDVHEDYVVRLRVKRLVGQAEEASRQEQAQQPQQQQAGPISGLAAGPGPGPGSQGGGEATCVPGATGLTGSLGRGKQHSQRGRGSDVLSGSGSASASEVATSGSCAGGSTRYVFVPNHVSADDDPVEAGELGEVAVAVQPEVKVRWCHRQDHRQRDLPQIFIKGDNIVLISREDQLSRPAAEAGAAWKLPRQLGVAGQTGGLLSDRPQR